MGGRSQETVLVCCAVLKDEIDTLVHAHWPDIHVRYLPSMLHMKPNLLASGLESLLDEELTAGHRVILVYGDCCGQMAELEKRTGVVRTPASNCCDLLLDRDEYKKYLREGVFFLLPEWTYRWKEIFSGGLGLNQENATSLMQDMQTRLVYLDTGVVPVPLNDIRECAGYCGLPYEIIAVSLDRLRTTIQEAITRISPG